MDTQNEKYGLKTTIIFASVMIFLALIYAGYNVGQGSLSDAELDEKVGKSIDRYMQAQQEAQRKAQAEANKPQKIEGVSIDDDAILGDVNAPVTIVEFSDYECPFCKRHFVQVFPELKEKYIDTGKVRLVFRDFPLDFHDPLATQEAIAAECAREQGDDGTYYKYHDLIFETTTSNGGGLGKEQLYDLAEQVGVDKSSFTECLDSEKYKDEVLKDIADGQSYGASGTPAFFINGWFLKGAYPFSAFEEIIEKELENDK